MVDMLNARRSWVRIPVLAEIFTHEISVKVYLHHLALEAVHGACERSQMYQFVSWQL